MRARLVLTLALVGLLGLPAAAAAQAEVLQYDVIWSVNSRFDLWNGPGGTAAFQAQGPGRLQLQRIDGRPFIDIVEFSSGTSGGFVIPPVDSVDVQDFGFTTGLPRDVETAGPGFRRQGGTFETSGPSIQAFTLEASMGFDCSIAGGCGGIAGWSSSISARGTRVVQALEPSGVFLIGLGAAFALTFVRRRRR